MRRAISVSATAVTLTSMKRARTPCSVARAWSGSATGRHQDATGPEHGEGTVQRLAADEIDDGVHLGGRLEGHRAEVDRLCGAELAHAVEVAGRGGGDHLGPGSAGSCTA